ncbi:hypothetical protein Ancab_016651 [Ancistrocladus abbreviatus]
MVPERELNPRESLWREESWQIESRGREPVKCWWESSIVTTELRELQVMPVKLQGELDGSQVEKSVALEDWREDLRLRRGWVSSEAAEETWESKERRERKGRKGSKGVAAGMVGDKGEDMAVGGVNWKLKQDVQANCIKREAEAGEVGDRSHLAVWTYANDFSSLSFRN